MKVFKTVTLIDIVRCLKMYANDLLDFKKI